MEHLQRNVTQLSQRVRSWQKNSAWSQLITANYIIESKIDSDSDCSNQQNGNSQRGGYLIAEAGRPNRGTARKRSDEDTCYQCHGHVRRSLQSRQGTQKKFLTAEICHEGN